MGTCPSFSHVKTPREEAATDTDTHTQEASAREESTAETMATVAGKYADELMRTARAIAMPGKGILAADESPATMGKRLADIGVENTEENRRLFRQLLLGSRPALEAYLSGVILCEETLFQFSEEPGCGGKIRRLRFVELLEEAGVAVGIKVDKGTVPLRPNSSSCSETATEGLDGLSERCERYYAAGARFAKWRAVLRIDVARGLPTELAVTENARSLARYAAICQSRGLVPIVEPELLLDGEHRIPECAAATERVLAATFKALADQGVLLEGTLLKPSMVTPGAAGGAATPEVVAGFTLQALQRTVPVAVPGIMFLSGGQSEEAACTNLCVINRLSAVKPWTLSFSYGRALQHSVLRTWKGIPANMCAARSVFTSLCRANSFASLGKPLPPLPAPPASGGGGAAATATAASNESLFVENYSY